MTTARVALTPDLSLVAACWDALVSPGDVHEARIPKSRKGPRRFYRTVSGYFTEREAFAAALTCVTGHDAEAVYVTLNPVDRALLARAANRLVNDARATTADADIVRLRHLLIDVDPVRPAGISATDAERDAALAARDAVYLYLHDEAGWSYPVLLTESGNGGGIIYRLDLPNEPDNVALLRDVLQGVAALFATPAVAIDITTYNPARITKVIGTVAAKGDDLPERPWRLAIGRVNPNPEPVPRERLAAVAALAPEGHAQRPLPSPNGHRAGRIWDIRDVLRKAGIGFRERSRPYATVLELDRCLTSQDHVDGAAILEFANGALAFRCLHNRCAGKGWAEAKAALGIPQAGASADQAAGRQGADSAEPAARLVIVRLADVASRPIDWLWPNWLARGKVHILGGHSGDGKSTLTAWLAAVLSVGGWLPDGHGAPVGGTLFLLGEDALDDTLRPRLDLHVADASRIDAVQAVREGERRRVFDLRKHLDLARSELATGRYALFVIDSLTAFMPQTDRNAEGDVRDVLTLLTALAEETDVAVLAVMHVGKPSGTNRRPLQLLLGATAFGAAARLVMMVAEVPAGDDEDGPARRVLGVVKSNIGPKPAPLEWSREIDGPVAWHGASEHDLELLLTGAKPAAIEAAKAFLLEALKGGSKTAAGLFQAARGEGISKATLRRAADALRVIRFKQPGVLTGPWLWRLPDGKPHHQEDAEGAQSCEGPDVSTFAPSPPNGATDGESPHDDGKVFIEEDLSTFVGEEAKVRRCSTSPNGHIEHLRLFEDDEAEGAHAATDEHLRQRVGDKEEEYMF